MPRVPPPSDRTPPAEPAGPRRRKLADVVTEQLRNDIIGGTYAPGERLVEGRLAEIYAVSRVPVREALKTLETEGLVSTDTTRGRIVARLSAEENDEIIPLRRVIEGMAAERAARSLSDDSREALRALLHRGQRALAADQGELLREVNKSVHQAIVTASGSGTLIAVYQPLLMRASWSNRSMLHSDRSELWHEHVQIVRAIMENDPPRARRLLEEHLDRWLASHHLDPS